MSDDGTVKDSQDIRRHQPSSELVGEEARFRALLQSEEKFRTLLETTGTGYVILDLEGKVLDANQVYVDLTGHRMLREIKGRGVVEWTAPEDRERNASEVAKCIEQGQVQDLEICYVTENGARIAIEINATRLGKGPSTRIVTICRNIAARKRVEEAQRQSDARLRAIVETTREWIWAIDLQGRHTYSNPAIARMLGYTPEEFIDIPIPQLIHPEDTARVQSLLADSVAKQQGWSGAIVRWRHKDGSYRHLESNSVPLLDQHGTLVGFQGADHDTTERERTQHALRYTQFAVDHAADAIFWADGDARFIYVNHSACSSLGYTREELLKLSVFDIAPELSKEQWPARWQRMAGGGKFTYESRRRTKTGQIVPVEITATRVDFEGVSYICGFARDISERKLSEQERERLHGQLLQSQKMEAIGRLAGGVAHDFNNLLTGILGFAELARMASESRQETEECLQGIVDLVAQSKALTTQILAFSRKQVLSTSVLDLNVVILSIGKLLRRIIGEDIEISLRLQPDLARVRADSAQLQQVLLNLAVNARDAMPNGGVFTIATTNTGLTEQAVFELPDMHPGEHVLITIKDTGNGMDSDTLHHAFEPFFTTKALGYGTGLGLATVYGIVRQHGGHIDVKSTLGSGTTFRILLPSVQDVADVAVSSEMPAAPRGHETLLVVEDDRLVRELTIRRLSSFGYEVISASSPTEAIAFVQQYPEAIALLVTDIVMPVMNGRRLFDELVAMRPSLKVLFMSGYAGDTLAELGGTLDLSLHLIQKPFGIADLASRIRRILDVPT